MHNVKEIEWRALESTEEFVIQNFCGTLKSCGRHLLYLENGYVPARFQVKRQMLNHLHYILNQPQNSLLSRLYESQRKNPVKGDWASEVAQIVINFEINLSNHEIKHMKESQFKNLTKLQHKKAAFQYILNKLQNGKKGKHIIYTQFEMADYLQPNCSLSVEDKRQMFAIRSETNDLPNNLGKSEICCNTALNNEHIIICQKRVQL